MNSSDKVIESLRHGSRFVITVSLEATRQVAISLGNIEHRIGKSGERSHNQEPNNAQT